MMNSQGATIRWSYFQSALQLAVRRSSKKWTQIVPYEDFAECFPIYTSEDKDGSTAIFNQISNYIESQSFCDLDKLFQTFNVQENIDTLHRIVEESKERRQRDMETKDKWREDLEPQAAIAARAIPKLEEKNIRLREMLSQIEAENNTLASQLQKRVEGAGDSEEEALRLLKKLDKVLDKWQELLSNELENWTRQMMESTKTVMAT